METTENVVAPAVLVTEKVIEVPIPVPVPVISEEKGEELTAWQSRVEQCVIAIQNSVQSQMSAILEALQSQREVNSSNQTCLLRIESLLSQLNQNPPNLTPTPAPTVVAIAEVPTAAPALAPAPVVAVVAPESAEQPEAQPKEKQTKRKVKKV